MPEPRRSIRRSAPSFVRYATLAARALKDGAGPEDAGEPIADDAAAAADGTAPLEQAARRVALAVPARPPAAEARPARTAAPYAAPAPAPVRRTVDRRC